MGESTKTFSTLYKKTATGATQIWFMEQDGPKYRTTSGQLNGVKTVTEWTLCEGKNIGKKNETSPELQASLEIAAQYKKKLAQGNYKESIEDINEDNFFKPMLANKYEDHPVTQHLIDHRLVISQPKLDGVRCIITPKGMFSRQGKEILSAPHIFEAVKFLFQAFNEDNPDVSDMVIDGELYNHDLKDNFNEIISLCRKSKPTAEDLEKSKQYIQYHIYDFPRELKFSQRFTNLISLLKLDSIFKDTFIKFVPTDVVTSFDHLNALYADYLVNGYEGQMVRIDNCVYENKRTSQLLKRKEFQDAEYDIVQIEEGLGNRSGMAGAITYKLPDGRLFRSGIKGGVDFYTKLLIDAESYIGGQGTVKFFQLTPDDGAGNGGVPRFPVTTAVFKAKRDL